MNLPLLFPPSHVQQPKDICARAGFCQSAVESFPMETLVAAKAVKSTPMEILVAAKAVKSIPAIMMIPAMKMVPATKVEEPAVDKAATVRYD